MSQSNYRAKRISTPPLMLAPTLFSFLIPNGTGNGTNAFVSVSWAQILAAIKGQLVISPLGTESLAGSIGAFDGLNSGIDPTLFDFSIAAVVVQTPTNVALVGLFMGGYDMGFAVDANQANAVLFASGATMSTTVTKVQTLSQPAQPGVIPLTSDLMIQVKTTALLGANQTVTVFPILWAQPRKDLA